MNYKGLNQQQTGIDESTKWEYEGIGYNASDGVFYVGEAREKTLSIIPFAMRQCKEVEDINGIVHRYPIKTAKKQMAEGDTTYRLQLVCQHEGELYTFGARAYTTRASFVNPAKGQWNNENIPMGIWHQLMDQISVIKAKHEAITSPCHWEMSLQVGKQYTAGTGKNTSSAKPIVLDGVFKFIGVDAANANTELYLSEDLDAWVNEWQGQIVNEEPAPEVTVEEDDEIPW